MISITKQYIDFPFAHRQPKHRGHCALIHGHNWSFSFVFSAKKLDMNGFVLDFGDLAWLRDMLHALFDHTLVLNEDDPWLAYLRESLLLQPAASADTMLANIVTVPNCGAEGLATYLLKQVGMEISDRYAGRVTLTSVTVHEDSKNTATVSL